MSRGHDRERAVRAELEAQGFWVGRCAGSLGDADLVALRAHPPNRTARALKLLATELRLPILPNGRKRLLVEVKSTAQTPFERFGPADRSELLDAAALAGADAVLAYCPPGRREWRWIWPEEWPGA